MLLCDAVVRLTVPDTFRHDSQRSFAVAEEKENYHALIR